MKRIFLGCAVLVAACSLTALARQAPPLGAPEGSLPPPPAPTQTLAP
jgi:hypothetical protein